MAVNRDKPDRWKEDITRSVDMYNDWFLTFAPEAFRSTRMQTTSALSSLGIRVYTTILSSKTMTWGSYTLKLRIDKALGMWKIR